MLSPDILKALKGYTENIENDVAFVLQTGEHPKHDELKRFLEDIASVSARIRVEERDQPKRLRSPVTFMIEVDGVDTGITFSGIPGGHEFNSLVLALLQATGTAMKLDDGLKTIIRGVDGQLRFETFVSLSCHNCPDIVQALNQFALLNPGISAEMIDGGVYPELVEARNIQGVPTVFLNGELFANGKIDVSILVKRLVESRPGVKATPTESLPLQDIAIVGGGPAGVSAAIYAARKGLKVVLVADNIGGQLNDTLGIENFIGTRETTGPKLTADLKEHMDAYDITLRQHLSVASVEDGPIKQIELTSGEVIKSRTLIIATGARWRELGCPGEKENIGAGVAYCPHCDGPFFKNKDVAVVGGGNSGVEAALDLAGIVKSVRLIEFLPELKADQVLVDQLARRDNIEVVKNAATQRIVAENGKVTGIEYADRASGDVHIEPLAGVFVQIGLLPNSDIFKDIVNRTRFGEIEVNDRCETSAEGVFACGDVTTTPYKQIVVATSEGAKAALSAFDYILKQPEPVHIAGDAPPATAEVA